jgi:hypothetical protein
MARTHQPAPGAMNTAILLAPALAFAVLAAHFYRAGAWIAVAIVAALLPLHFVRAPWAARTLQACLVLGGLEWIRTAIQLVALRESMGQPWTRLAIILGSVALATALCALVFETRGLRSRFGLPARPRA